MEFIRLLDRILETRMFVIAGTTINVVTVLMFGIIVLVTFIISSVVRRAVRRSFEKRGVSNEGSIRATSRLLHSSVNFEVSVWVDDPWGTQGGRSEMHQAIWWALKEAGVTIAFPQLDVHLDPPVQGAFERMASA